VGKKGRAAAKRTPVVSEAYAGEMIRTPAKRAEGGGKEAADSLMRWLDAYPHLRTLVHQLDDLAARAERAWLDRL